MAHSPITIVDVQNRIIRYFAQRFHWPETDFDQDTNVKTAFNFNEAAWRGLATDTFNRFDWMIQYFKPISQPEMGGVATIGEIVKLIWSKRKASPKMAKAIAVEESTMLAEAGLVTTNATKATDAPLKSTSATKAKKNKTKKNKTKKKKTKKKKAMKKKAAKATTKKAPANNKAATGETANPKSATKKKTKTATPKKKKATPKKAASRSR